MIYNGDEVEMPAQMRIDIERLIEEAKRKIGSCIEDMLSKVYIEYAPYIETDVAANYRNDLRSALHKAFIHNKPATNEEYWAEQIRKAYFEEHREELMQGLLADACRERDQYRKWYQESLQRR